jgi:hypothetical protein
MSIISCLTGKGSIHDTPHCAVIARSPALLRSVIKAVIAGSAMLVMRPVSIIRASIPATGLS